ncbi:MAG: ABC transporter ATP-binding protein [Bacillota bacterium]|nr:ABC transporter ATP-binding protein [Bacillota bacterium]MDD3851681.1 ABC transporter ATP-binding protein [Bacillota bacterium]
MIEHKSTVITLNNATKVYYAGNSEVRALQNISLDIKKGDYVAVVGHSGSGKSTLLRVIGALELPTEGEVYINGIPTGTLDAKELTHVRAKTVGFVFQDFRLLPQLTAVENVMIPLLPYKGKKSVEVRAKKLLEQVRLRNRMHHKPSELSGGEQQRVAIARALVREPRLILADELTGNLDTQTRDQIMELLDGLNQEGLTVVVATHDMGVMDHCHRHVRLQDGMVV